ncbi:MAG: hypothetical protein V4511_04925 [Bacteroidota bacterium]
MLKVALTHDIDRIDKTYQYFTHAAKGLFMFDFKSAAYHMSSAFNKHNSYWGFDEMIAIEQKYGVKSTCYFLNESIKVNPFDIYNWKLSLGRYDIHDPRIVQIIKWLDNNGWDIGVHGSYNSYLHPDLLKKEKAIMEKIVGHELIGIRQHYLNISSQTWAWQKQAGFKYDSSFGLTDSIGFKENKIKTFRPFNDYFAVIPMVIMDYPFVVLKDPMPKLNNLIDICIQNNSLLCINWHNNYFTEKEFPLHKKSYIMIIEECLKRNARFYTMRDYYAEILL